MAKSRYENDVFANNHTVSRRRLGREGGGRGREGGEGGRSRERGIEGGRVGWREVCMYVLYYHFRFSNTLL